tara:strand:+ start:25947 stop:26216 length:270 start_codon:yes stop_codon:yes gene_type:complete
MKIVLQNEEGFYKDLAEFEARHEATAFVEGYKAGRKYQKEVLTIPNLTPQQAYELGWNHCAGNSLSDSNAYLLGLEAGRRLLKGKLKVV